MFHFKKFSIDDSCAAMKIGTDSVLLGAWTDCTNETRILDIGTGTGILALMMAQRNPGVPIDAVELENEAADLALQNVKLSPWQSQISIKNISLQDFAIHNKQKYSLVLSNPPFFTASLKSPGHNRTLARHNDTLPVSDLLKISSELLTFNGKASFIFPSDSFLAWKTEAKKVSLYIKKLTHIKSTPNHQPHRVLVTFSKKQQAFSEDDLSIYTSEKAFSEEYRNLTRDYYLHF